MSERRALRILTAAFIATATSQAAGQVPAAAPVRQVDHVMIRTGDPGALFAFFVEVLQLPVAWPLMSPRDGVKTGGVSFGNVNVEAIQFPGQTDNRPQLIGFALEPSELGASLKEMDRRGITYGPPRPVVSKASDGSATTLWTNVTLRQFSDSDSPADATVHIFLSEYNSTYVNVAERSALLRRQLVARDGGPLGIEGVQELVIGVKDLEAGRALWQTLLAPAAPIDRSVWPLGAGPAVRLVSAKTNAVQQLVIRVASLPRATSFLRAKGLLGIDTPEEATIHSTQLNGLNFRLVEAR